jgi:hypothetical protein
MAEQKRSVFVWSPLPLHNQLNFVQLNILWEAAQFGGLFYYQLDL